MSKEGAPDFDCYIYMFGANLLGRAEIGLCYKVLADDEVVLHFSATGRLCRAPALNVQISISYSRLKRCVTSIHAYNIIFICTLEAGASV